MNESTPAETPSTNKLVVKLARILGEVGKVEKSGTNEYHGYNYITENDLVYAVRKLLSDAAIFVFTSVESQTTEIIKSADVNGSEKLSILTCVTTKHTFVDGDTGETFSVLSQGQGADVGDKGGYKAITGAMKYFIYKSFMIPTGDDPEADAKTDQRGHSETHAAQEGSAGTHSKQETGPKTPPPAQKAATPAGSPGLKPWRDVIVPPFIKKYAGTKLGDMALKDLRWWAGNYVPKPWKGSINPKDTAFRAALTAALVEVGPGDEGLPPDSDVSY